MVIDEAHRLRNVYKPGNKIASSIKRTTNGRPKLLLTATPLQNSLLELYGLVSFLDEHLFGDVNAFRMRYMRGATEDRQLGELRRRIQHICQRTLRRQVSEYVRFTNRIPLTQDFTPTPEEQQLYDRVSAHLQREVLHALPQRQLKLMTLVLRKLLASSTFAIAKTLESLATRLQERRPDLIDDIAADFDVMDEIAEEWTDSENTEPTDETQEASESTEILAEIRELAGSGSLAASITVNAKGEALLQALDLGFAKLEELGANRKAVIFTESRRTQDYLVELLAGNGYDGRVLAINGVNAGQQPNAIYKAWVQRHKGEPVVTGNKVVDIRAALVEHFRDAADILVATEAAAEGINLLFCSLVVNYDLPWNPQRIEQRILIHHLQSNVRASLISGTGVAPEKRLEDYLVRALMDYDDISYDEHAELLYKLAGQMVEHLRSYLADEEEITNVLQYHQQMLAGFIHAQMQAHYWERSAGYEATISKGFTTLRPNSFAALAGETVRPFRAPVEDRLYMRGMLFGGFNRCLYPTQKFDNDTERRFAVLLEDDRVVCKWFKPARGQFQIEYQNGHLYEPDSVVETDSTKLICETKRVSEMEDPVVQAKANAAVHWCEYATRHQLENGGKPWSYLLIPHDAVTAAATLQGLLATYSSTFARR